MTLRRVTRVLLASLAACWLVWIGVAASHATLRAPPPTPLVRDAHGRFLTELPDPTTGELGYWPVDRVPWRVAAATLTLEDRRFWRHPGVDGRGVARALLQNWRAGETVSGASTIAMQVARMQRPGDRTYPRKATEALAALMLTGRYGREAVLCQYLTLAPYGNRIHGIRYAARRYLDKPIDDLSWAETAFLTALPQAPSRTNPFQPDGRRRAVARGHRILDVLDAQDLLTPEEVAQAHAELDALRFPPRDERPIEALHAVLHLESELRAAPPADPLVTATLDLDVQGRVAAHVGAAVREWGDRGAGNAAVLVVTRDDGRVVASVGSAGYYEADAAGAIDYVRVPRNAGSTLKPFLYAEALERGVITPGTVLDDLSRAPDGIGNADEDFLGPMLPREALANSRNVPAVSLLEQVGVGEAYALYRDLGLHDDTLPAAHYGLGLAIGGLPVTLERLVTAYGALATDGRHRELVWYEGQARPPPRVVFAPETARAIAGWLSDPMARLPTFPRMGPGEYPFPVALKTGTSQDYRDAWVVAWSDRYVVGVWIGDPRQRPMEKLSGFEASAALARRVLLDLHADRRQGLADGAFPPPEGWSALPTCPLSGRRAGAACDRAVREWFPPGAAPIDPCETHLRLAIDRRTGRLATADAPDAVIDERTFVDLPSRYAPWMARVGLERPPLTSDRSGGADTSPTLRIVAPSPGAHFVRDVDSAAGTATVSLRAAVDPPVPQIVWYVDGRPYEVADWPYEVRWPLTPGEHRIEARVPFTDHRSAAVRITAR